MIYLWKPGTWKKENIRIIGEMAGAYDKNTGRMYIIKVDDVDNINYVIEHEILHKLLYEYINEEATDKFDGVYKHIQM